MEKPRKTLEKPGKTRKNLGKPFWVPFSWGKSFAPPRANLEIRILLDVLGRPFEEKKGWEIEEETKENWGFLRQHKAVLAQKVLFL